MTTKEINKLVDYARRNYTKEQIFNIVQNDDLHSVALDMLKDAIDFQAKFARGTENREILNNGIFNKLNS